MLIDLHAHSTASDGTLAPADVVAAAVTAGVDVLALTDHDTTSGWDEAARAAVRHGLTLVPGIEVSCQVPAADGARPADREGGPIGVHLLGYLVDPLHPELTAELDVIREDRRARARRMVDRLATDLPLTWDDVVRQVPVRADAVATVGRPHIADAMVAAGLVTSRDEAFAGYLHARSPYHVPHYAPGAEDAVRLLTDSGGVPVIAHPRAGRRGRIVSGALIGRLAAAGLRGIEADHRDHDDTDRRQLRDLAADLGLFVTGSSDFHGAGKQNRLGENRTAPEVLDEIVAAGTGTPVVRP